jgi:DNA-binding XRE family transcriptional regulator
MARLAQDTKDKILADFHIGKSQNQLSKDYDCSPATINKICKGVTPKYKDKLNTVVSIKSELAHESEYQSECFDKEVNTQLRRASLVFGSVEKAVKKMNDIIESGYVEDKINVGDGMQKFEQRQLNTADVKNALDGYDKASITLGVNQRHANNTTAIQINSDEKKVVRSGVGDLYKVIRGEEDDR